MRPRHLLVLTLAALTIYTCEPTSPGPGTPQPFAEACDPANEGQIVSVEGYLRLPDVLPGGDTVELALFPDLSFTGVPIGVAVRFGDGPNQAKKISSSYRDDDLKVHLADGTLVPFGTKLRVSGRVTFPVAPPAYQCELKNPYTELTK